MLSIDSYPFRDPNKLETGKITFRSTWRGFNGTLNIDQLDFPNKKEQKLSFDYLTNAEWTWLQDYLDAGFFAVYCDVDGHEFTYDEATIDLVSSENHGFSGGRVNVQILIREK